MLSASLIEKGAGKSYSFAEYSVCMVKISGKPYKLWFDSIFFIEN